MRTLDSTLAANMTAGHGSPVARVQIMINAIGPAWSSAYELKRYKIDGPRIVYRIFQKDVSSFMATFEGGEQIVRILRGLSVSGIEYTIPSPHYIHLNYRFVFGGDMLFEATAIPEHKTVISTSAIQTAAQVIEAVMISSYSAAYDSIEKWHTWQFERAGTFAPAYFSVLLDILYQKYFVRPFARDSGSILFLSPSTRYYSSPVVVTGVEFYPDSRFHEIYPRLSYVDETGEWTTTPQGNRNKTIGFIHSSVPDTDVQKLQTPGSGWYFETVRQRPDWRFEEGDYIQFSTPFLSNLKGILTLEEEYISAGRPAWWQQIKATPILPLDTASLTMSNPGGEISPSQLIVLDTFNFDGILSARDTSIQAAMDTIDDHQHGSSGGPLAAYVNSAWISNTTAETDILSFLIPACTLYADSKNVAVVIKARLVAYNDAAGANFNSPTYKYYLDGTYLWAHGNLGSGLSQNRWVASEIEFVVAGDGSLSLNSASGWVEEASNMTSNTMSVWQNTRHAESTPNKNNASALIMKITGTLPVASTQIMMRVRWAEVSLREIS